MFVDILARDRVLVGRQQTFTILVGNRGMPRDRCSICIAGIPKDCKWKREFKITDPPQVEGEEPVDWTDVPHILRLMMKLSSHCFAAYSLVLQAH